MPELGQLLSLEYGAALPAERRSGHGFPVFGSNGEVGRHDQPLVDGPGIVIGRKGSVGKVCWSEDPFWPIDTTYWVKCAAEQRRWIYWLLSRLPLAELDSSTGVPGLNRNDVYELSVFEPPTADEKSQIAAVLDTIDTTIRQTEAIIEKLKQVKQGLLHDLLTRGIDANGELRPPQSEAPHLYKDSPLGWIPREWEASDVAREFDVTSGITLGPHRAPRSNARKYLRVANVQRGRIELSDVAELDTTAAEMRARELVPGDLLVVEGHASTEEIGRCAMADEAVRGFTFQNHLFRLRAIRLLAVFALYWMNSGAVRAYWRTEAATSSGLNTINRTKLSRVLVPVPDASEQQRIILAVESINQRIECEMTGLSKMRAERSGLMDDLLTGRVRVAPLLETSHA